MGDSSVKYDRKRAVALKALDARDLLKNALPEVLKIMTQAQIQQVQRVLDAAVVNPAAQKEYQDLMRRSIVFQSGMVVQRDERIVRKATRAFESQIPISASDKRVRLDLEKILAPDALKPQTDNPDEANYLRQVKEILETKGVWLRFEPQLVRSAEDYGTWVIDGRTFKAWLTLGPGDSWIPTENGLITREALLDNTSLGAGYYKAVWMGGVQTELKETIRNLRSQISTGEVFHEQQAEARDSAVPLVPTIVDAVGGADYPSKKIWDGPNALVLEALRQNVGGNVLESTKTLYYAAILTDIATRRLEDYNARTMKAGAKILGFLSIIEKIGKIAEYALVLRALVSKGLRYYAQRKAAAQNPAKQLTAGAKDHSPAAYYDTNYVGKEGFGKTYKIGDTMPSGHGGTLNRFDLATQNKINGWHAEFDRRVKEIMAAKGETGGGWVLSKEEFAALDREVSKKWGDIWALWD